MNNYPINKLNKHTKELTADLKLKFLILKYCKIMIKLMQHDMWKKLTIYILISAFKILK